MTDLAPIVSEWANDPRTAQRVVHVARIPARPARHSDVPEDIHPALKRALDTFGIHKLYLHQAEAFEKVRAGSDIAVVTSTASGKTLCYNLPILDHLLNNTEARALYLFPTKALAQDQLGVLRRWAEADPAIAEVLRPATYDGDTPTHDRKKIRNSASIILSNPDMLHVGILPYHPRWGSFLRNLKYVVVDELHTYRGIFGSNVAQVMRRLARVCEHYGSRPQFICASATIANPHELASALVGRECEVIDTDGSPRGERLFVLWNPPRLSNDNLTRRSANVEAVELLTRLVSENVQTIVFGKARVVVELIYRYARERLQKRNKALADRIRPYRGGYLPRERREIEKQLFSGELLGVCATSALELGIDVGSLDAAILVGFPGTIASTWQRAGRAGRKEKSSLSVLIAYNDPIDQYIMHNPKYFFGQAVEHGIVDPQNAYILASHLGCAACELPLREEDEAVFGPFVRQIAEILADEGKLKEIDGRHYWSTTENPSQRTNLRTISDDTFSIVDQSEAKPVGIGNVDSISAPELVYPGAIYLHEGESYQVRELDWDGKVAHVKRSETDYYTQPVLADKCTIVRELEQKAEPGMSVRFGEMEVTWQTVAFKKIRYHTLENIGQATLDLPSQTLQTTGLWLVPDSEVMDDVAGMGLKPVEALMGVRNLMLVCLPMLAMCDRRDLSGIVESSNTGSPTAFIYDRFLGGLGFAQKGYELIHDLLRMCTELLDGCECEEGCPSCVGLANLRPPVHQDPDLSRGYMIPSKLAVVALINRLTGRR